MKFKSLNRRGILHGMHDHPTCKHNDLFCECYTVDNVAEQHKRLLENKLG
jgi:hypothetical protein